LHRGTLPLVYWTTFCGSIVKHLEGSTCEGCKAFFADTSVKCSAPKPLLRFALHIRPAEPDVAQHAVIESEERLALLAVLAPPTKQCERMTEQLGKSGQP